MAGLDPEQLPRHLARELAPLYVVHGDEPLLALEAADRIRAAARSRGHDEREVLVVESGFDWGRLRASGASLSLFASRRLLEVRLPSGSPGVQGAEALAAHAAALPPDTVTLVTLPKLERKTTETRWFSALAAAGVVVHAQRVGFERLPAWLASRLRSQDQSADEATLRFLAERVEGNLLAAHQEVLKLGLLFPPGPLEAGAVREAVSDVARYEAFDLGPVVLAGDAVHALRMLDGLRAEGTAPPLVLWALADQARTLLALREASDAGVPMAQALREARVWGERQRAAQAALRRLGHAQLRTCLGLAARVDRVAKGVAAGDPWDGLRQLVLALAAPGRFPLGDSAP